MGSGMCHPYPEQRAHPLQTHWILAGTTQLNSRTGRSLSLHTFVVEVHQLDDGKYGYFSNGKKKFFRTRFVKDNKVSTAEQHDSGTDASVALFGDHLSGRTCEWVAGTVFTTTNHNSTEYRPPIHNLRLVTHGYTRAFWISTQIQLP